MVKHFGNIKKSESDKYQYRALELDNELTVFLIHDPEAEKAGASLEVHVGAYRDPREFQGLAHFLEHMLFIGSEKYPGEGEYMTFLGQNGGYSNAYTSQTVTNYHFEVKDEVLIKGLDMFAQFFISPLFKDESVFKEINAVNSEAEMYYNNQYWRMFHMESVLSDPKSEQSKYNVGNLDTLGNLRGHLPLQSDKKEGETEPAKPLDPDALVRKNALVQALKDFHKKHYSANQMVLAVYSKTDLDTLEKNVVEIFSPIENKKLVYQGFKNELPPYPKETLSKFVKVVPVNQGSKIIFAFKLAGDFDTDKHSRASGYVGHLLGHESEGSILHLLMQENLATDLMVDFENHEDYTTDLIAEIGLTTKGATKEFLPRVIAAVGAYFKLLRSEQIQDWIVEEISKENEISFRYKCADGGMDRVVELTENYMYHSTVENLLFAPYDYSRFDKADVARLIANLTVENLQVYFLSSGLQNTESFTVDPIYKTKYLAENIRPELIQAFNEGDLSWTTTKIHLPEKNTFLPKNFDLKPQATTGKPARVRETEGSVTWHWQDNKFSLPKCACSVHIHVDPEVAFSSAESAVSLNLWSELFRDNIRSLTYMAEMAKIENSISITNSGLEISVNSYDESLKPYLIKYFDTLSTFLKDGFSEQKFVNYREAVEQNLIKIRNSAPFRYVLSSLFAYAGEPFYGNDEKSAAIKTLTFESLKLFHQKLLTHIRFDWLIEGNITAEEAIDISSSIEAQFQASSKPTILAKEEIHQTRIIKLKPNENKVVETLSKLEDEKNVAFVKLLQIGNGDASQPKLEFINDWLKNPYFEDLRTQQQLGYAVFCMNRVLNGVRHFAFCIQSDVKSTHFCIQKSHEFITKYHKELKEMTAEKFEEIRSGVLTTLKEPKKNLYELFYEDWAEIKQHQYKFGRSELMIPEVEKLTKEDIIAFYEEYFINNPRCFELHQYSHALKEDSIKQREERQKNEKGFIYYPSANALKRSCELFVDYTSLI